MFMETLNIVPGKDVVHLGLMDYGPDGERPEVDGEILYITLPLSQFQPILHQFDEAFESDAYLRTVGKRVASIR